MDLCNKEKTISCHSPSYLRLLLCGHVSREQGSGGCAGCAQFHEQQTAQQITHLRPQWEKLLRKQIRLSIRQTTLLTCSPHFGLKWLIFCFLFSYIFQMSNFGHLAGFSCLIFWCVFFCSISHGYEINVQVCL